MGWDQEGRGGGGPPPTVTPKPVGTARKRKAAAQNDATEDAEDEEAEDVQQSNGKKARGGSRTEVFPVLSVRRPPMTEYDLPIHIRNWQKNQTKLVRALLEIREGFTIYPVD